MNSSDTKIHYDDQYFLHRVEGWKDFKKGEIYPKKKQSAERLPFRGKSILDVGFGRGELLVYCYDNSALQCVGIDYSPSATHIAKSFAADRAIKFYEGSLAEISIKENFDCVYFCDVWEHISDEEIQACMVKLNLNPGAKILVETPSHDHGDFKGMHINYLSDQKIREHLKLRCSSIEIVNDGNWFIAIGTV